MTNAKILGIAIGFYVLSWIVLERILALNVNY